MSSTWLTLLPPIRVPFIVPSPHGLSSQGYFQLCSVPKSRESAAPVVRQLLTSSIPSVIQETPRNPGRGSSPPRRLQRNKCSFSGKLLLFRETSAIFRTADVFSQLTGAVPVFFLEQSLQRTCSPGSGSRRRRVGARLLPALINEVSKARLPSRGHPPLPRLCSLLVFTAICGKFPSLGVVQRRSLMEIRAPSAVKPSHGSLLINRPRGPRLIPG